MAPVCRGRKPPRQPRAGRGRLGRLVGVLGRTVQWRDCWGPLCRRAKLLLKKKRYREQLLDKAENPITSLETMSRLGGSGVWAV